MQAVEVVPIPHKRTWAEVYLDNIRHNYRMIRSVLPAGCRFLGVVKANAYGHGAVQVAQVLEECGADYLAVACLDEALELRREGIRLPILILGYTPEEYTSELIDHQITQAVTSLKSAERYSGEAAKLGKTLKVHIKVDSGMSRLGFLCTGKEFDVGVSEIAKACRLPNLDCEGIFTHFSVSDEGDQESREFTAGQFRVFMDVINWLEQKEGIRFAIRHCSNTGATLDYPETYLDMVRPGLLLYGYGDMKGRLNLKPCMGVFTTVASVKTFDPGASVSYGRRYRTEENTCIGVLGIGYADGLPRAISGKCSFYTKYGLIHQRGTICMDMCMADLSDAEGAEEGTEVEIFGNHSSIYQLSEAAGTIPYEILCGISRRVPRIYR